MVSQSITKKQHTAPVAPLKSQAPATVYAPAAGHSSQSPLRSRGSGTSCAVQQ